MKRSIWAANIVMEPWNRNTGTAEKRMPMPSAEAVHPFFDAPSLPEHCTECDADHNDDDPIAFQCHKDITGSGGCQRGISRSSGGLGKFMML
nr:hypothetical protein [Salinicoccus roseus]